MRTIERARNEGEMPNTEAEFQRYISLKLRNQTLT
jgi:hypothetical protein